MSDNKYYVNLGEIELALSDIDFPGNKIYGVPNGGLMAAAFLKRATVTLDIREADFILDDVLDSGNTLKFYQAHYPEKECVVIINKQSQNLMDRWIVFPWESQHPKGEQSIEENVLRQLQYLGEDTKRDGLLETPKRVVKSWKQLFSGYEQNPADCFKIFEAEKYDEIVILKNIEMYSTCEHHMLPFYGKAHIAYIAQSKVIGVSKLARLLEVFARRLQIQERIGLQVVTALDEHLDCLGSACIIEATHMCMTARGISKQNSTMVTSSLTGKFRTDPAVRAELMNLIK